MYSHSIELNKNKWHLHCQKIPCVHFCFASTWPQNLLPNDASQNLSQIYCSFLSESIAA